MHSLVKTGAILGVALAASVGITYSAARDNAPRPSQASSHREAPGISQDPAVDNTDLYAWVAPDASNMVTFVMNTYPDQSAYGGPNFFRFADGAVYALNIDNDGDAKADIRYEFVFRTVTMNPNTFLYNTGPIKSLDDPNWNVRQYYNVDRLNMQTGNRVRVAADVPTPPVNVGSASIPDYENVARQAIRTIDGGMKMFAGQRDDPFFVDLGAIFDLLQIRPMMAYDSLQNKNVNSIILQIPIEDLARAGQPIIGIWETVSRDGKQVSRLGQPLVNEAVLPLALKDAFNSISPDVDRTIDAAVAAVTDPEIPKLLKLLFNIDSPPAPRMDLVTIFLTGIPMLNQPPNVVPSEMLRLNTSTPPAANPNRMGLLGGDSAGFPNGRRLTDDVIDIALQVMAGATPFTADFNKAPNNTLGDGVNANDMPFQSSFPYLATPTPGNTTRGLQPSRP